MPIRGWYKTAYKAQPAPYVRAVVILSRLRLWGLVDFLADTGADGTSLHSTDITAIGIDVSKLDQDSLAQASGVGGSAAYYAEPAVLLFVNNGTLTRWHTSIDIEALNHSQANTPNTLPSILGRDFLNYFSITADPRNNRFLLEPYSDSLHLGQ